MALVRTSKIKREIKILEAVKGGPNIINLLNKSFNPIYKTTCLVRKSPNLLTKNRFSSTSMRRTSEKRRRVYQIEKPDTTSTNF